MVIRNQIGQDLSKEWGRSEHYALMLKITETSFLHCSEYQSFIKDDVNQVLLQIIA